ncbi:MAG: hypothetical protein JO247_07265 [Chloroflexi bacterium]|nr:hypothetical protein [Chloroflexota bacterium]
MQFELTPGQAEVLERVLRNYLGDLSMEIRDTENHDFRQDLKDDREAVLAILDKVRTTAR